MEPRKPHFIFYSFLACLLVIFHLVYGGYASGITATDGIIVYDNVSDILYFCGFSMFFFLYGYQVRDYGRTKSTLVTTLLIIVFALVSSISGDAQKNYIDFAGIIDGTWLMWFLPVLGVYLLTSIPISGRKIELHPYYKAWVAVAMVVAYVLLRIGFHGIVDFKAYHLGKLLFFLPIFYFGYFYRTQLEPRAYFIDYVRVSSWACASVLMIISLVLLRYMDFDLLQYGTLYEALMQLTCIVMALTLFASFKERCLEMKELSESTLVVQSCIPVIVFAVLLYDTMITHDRLVEVLNTHFILMPLALSLLLITASYSFVLLSVLIYRLFVSVKPEA